MDNVEKKNVNLLFQCMHVGAYASGFYYRKLQIYHFTREQIFDIRKCIITIHFKCNNAAYESRFHTTNIVNNNAEWQFILFNFNPGSIFPKTKPMLSIAVLQFIHIWLGKDSSRTHYIIVIWWTKAEQVLRSKCRLLPTNIKCNKFFFFLIWLIFSFVLTHVGHNQADSSWYFIYHLRTSGIGIFCSVPLAQSEICMMSSTFI